MNFSLNLPKDEFGNTLLGIFSKNWKEWSITDLAWIFSNIVSVPFYSALSHDEIKYIINQAQLSLIAWDKPKAIMLMKMKENKEFESLRHLLWFEELTEEEQILCENIGLKYHLFNEAIQAGEKLEVQLDSPNNNSILTIHYTSGTTGNPKGVILKHRSYMGKFKIIESKGFYINENDVHYSYLPLGHCYERGVFLSFLVFGWKIGFSNGNIAKILEDIALLKPTLFCAVPKIINKLYDGIRQKFENQKGLNKKLVDCAVKTKLFLLENFNCCSHFIYDKLIFNKIKMTLGGRVRMLITGGAPLSKDVFNFIKICFIWESVEGYGLTETNSGFTITYPWDMESGHVGGPNVNGELKLVDIPDMGYYSTDVIEGVNMPRGEICYRSTSNFSGYYKDQELTNQAIDSDKWFHTGDIGMIQSNGSLKIIGRK